MAHPQTVDSGRPARLPPVQPDEDWPFDALRDFTVRMAGHGLTVSSRMMAGNRRYAVEQLACAHALGDPILSELALALFRHFEQQRSGVLHTA